MIESEVLPSAASTKKTSLVEWPMSGRNLHQSLITIEQRKKKSKSLLTNIDIEHLYNFNKYGKIKLNWAPSANYN